MEEQEDQHSKHERFDRIINSINEGESLSNEDSRFLAALIIDIDQHITAVNYTMTVVAGLIQQIPDTVADSVWKGLNLRDKSKKHVIASILRPYSQMILSIMQDVFTERYDTPEEEK